VVRSEKTAMSLKYPTIDDHGRDCSCERRIKAIAQVGSIAAEAVAAIGTITENVV